MDLHGQTAIVSGASSGIGAATGRALADRGADVVLAARRRDRLEDLADELSTDHGVEAVAVPTDVSDEDDVDTLIDRTVDAFGGLDILVNNAGINRGSDMATLDTESFRDMNGVNIDGCFFTTRAALPHLVESSGLLIFTGSIAGQYPRSFNPAYAASKWWVRGFALSVSAQYGDEGVGVSVVNPSEVRSEFVGSSGDRFNELFDEGEVTEPAEVAEAIAFAASTEGSVPFEIDFYRRDKLADTF